MDLWHDMIFPMRRVWSAVSTRVKARKNGGGLLKLHNDVQTCGYQDVQVMWEMLQRSESELTAQINSAGCDGNSHSSTQTKRKQWPLWRVFVWSHRRGPTSLKRA
ncbi:hypothetical protein Syun_024889 [Stephania yunnanensis]|uniref:Uncharacterized protein n=1 Tax=Stephania yunnanensis TaxID=152371 RepID=A0AAP0HU80_9MAGN